MVALIIIVCAVAFILLVADRRTETTRWIAIISILTSIAAFSVEWEKTFIPIIEYFLPTNTQKYDSLMMVNAALTTIPQYVLPYCFIMYSISFHETMKTKGKLITGTILTIPVFYSFLFLPFKPNSWRTTIESKIYFRSLSIWCIPYIIAGILIMIYSTVKERNPRIKLQKKLTVIIALPIAASCIINHFILRSMGYENAWRYIVPVLTVMFGFFLYFGVKYGIMGVNIRFDKQRIENVIRSISSGTEMLNHTLKNEVIKISMSTVNIKISSNKPTPDMGDINYNLEVIENSTGYLKNIIGRIQSFTRDFSLEESPNSLLDMLNQACKNIVNYIDCKGIKIENSCKSDVYLECDREHITEALTNILKNACEALGNEGKIEISVFGNRKTVSIAISDNGHGICRDDIQHLFEPYFSTKDKKNNFGLGLSYCYTVMNKHKGNIDISSEEGKGTTVILSFPSFRVLKCDKKIPLRGDYV
jgi:signal transduction histidine kinase